MATVAEFLTLRILLRLATTALGTLGGLGVVATPPAEAQIFSVLHRFTGSPDGANPQAGLIMDQAGNLYGTTLQGGASYQYGTVFMLDPSGNLTVLYSFSGGSDGCCLLGGLIMDQAGSLYGTTYGGLGTVFKLQAAGDVIAAYRRR